ncbi:AAA family ATPase [Pseudomonas cichorii]|uniref:AAA family ATPase n=1 Tax=Pseudomonas cichorii TaxID=36746 RepID=UPI001C8A1EA2|nr:ATP-binding protein [Pseudomonas cichorii]MBX8496576.1 AAA family ATPase [Pseudomonas cichorii]
MQILSKLKIKGFKSILNESLDLGQLNVFIGTNGAGKSNLLEAIAMISASLEGGIDYERLQKRGSRLSSSAIFRSAFKNKPRANTLSLEAELGNLSYSMNINAVDGFRYLAESVKLDNKNIAGRSNNGSKILGSSLSAKIENTKGIFPLLEAYKTLNPSVTFKDDGKNIDELSPLSMLKKYAIYSPSTPILRGVAPDPSAKEPIGLYGGLLADALTNVINANNKNPDFQRFFKMLNWVESFTTTTETDLELVTGQVAIAGRKIRYTDNFMKNNFNKLYAYDVSEGALYIIFMLVILIHKDSPDIFAIDNIDTALNPGLVRNLMLHVVEILRKKPNKQIFLTTHNPSTLDAVDLFDPTHRLFVVERNKEGHTKTRRIEPPHGMSKHDWEEKFFGMKLSEIWQAGAIGGLPTGF